MIKPTDLGHFSWKKHLAIKGITYKEEPGIAKTEACEEPSRMQGWEPLTQ